jgi:hypothetical protein
MSALHYECNRKPGCVQGASEVAIFCVLDEVHACASETLTGTSISWAKKGR